MVAIRIPKKNNHPAVGDNLTRYYHLPLVRYFFLKRLRLVLDLLGPKHFDSILEIGFGSGVLLPELSKRAIHLCGIDIHDSVGRVNEMLKKEGLNAALANGDILHLPYKDETFDCVISIATLEHIKQLPEAISEIRRILKKGGVAVLGFPVANKVSDLLLVLTGSLQAYQKKLREIHPSSHSDILAEVRKQFGNIKVKRFPNFLPLDLSLYCSCRSIRND
jgi:ubiquinone/menaquinone biosynthesis C-methylase UbiE